jgi:phosphoribosylpyrophosphate synthetase
LFCFSAIPLSRAGPSKLLVYDLHALQERFYFGDNVIPICDTATQLFRSRVSLMIDHGNVVIAFPDEGAWKRFGNLWRPYEFIICSKTRDGDKRLVSIQEGNCKGRHVVIVDDLVQTGGTLLECALVMTKQGAVKVSACCTHAVFPNNAWKRFVGSLFSFFWVTNSIPTTTNILQGHSPFEVLSLAPLISSMLVERQIARL